MWCAMPTCRSLVREPLPVASLRQLVGAWEHFCLVLFVQCWLIAPAIASLSFFFSFGRRLSIISRFAMHTSHSLGSTSFPFLACVTVKIYRSANRTRSCVEYIMTTIINRNLERPLRKTRVDPPRCHEGFMSAESGRKRAIKF